MTKVSNSELIQLANKLIKKPIGKVTLINPVGKTMDIVNEVKDINRLPSHTEDTKRFAQCLKNSKSLKQTIMNVFWFTAKNIAYKVDGYAIQKTQTPSVIWNTRLGDCKSYALFQSSLLKNLNIPHNYKFAGYDPASDNVTHVYIEIPLAGGNYVVLDPCMKSFDKEKTPVTSLIVKP